MESRRFIQCDVFSPIPTQGNGLAVVVDAEGLTNAQFQRFAAWTNLAETTYLLPPTDAEADYRVRIFTPTREMPFAGHPTLGSCAAWLHAGGVPKQQGVVRQECAIGIVEIDVSEQRFAFVAPPTDVAPLPDQQFQAVTDALEISPEHVLQSALLDNGPVWRALHLDSAARVLALDSSRISWPAFEFIGVIGAHPAGAECDYEVRMLASSGGLSEDPITGSLNAALACWLRAEGRLTGPVTIAQGTCINRHGRVSVKPERGTERIFIGGDTHIVIDGTVKL